MCRKCNSGDDSPPPFYVLLTTYTMFERDSADNKADRRFLRWDTVSLIEVISQTCQHRDAALHMRTRTACDPLRRRVANSTTPWSHILLDEVLACADDNNRVMICQECLHIVLPCAVRGLVVGCSMS